MIEYFSELTTREASSLILFSTDKRCFLQLKYFLHCIEYIFPRVCCSTFQLALLSLYKFSWHTCAFRSCATLIYKFKLLLLLYLLLQNKLTSEYVSINSLSCLNVVFQWLQSHKGLDFKSILGLLKFIKVHVFWVYFQISFVYIDFNRLGTPP